MLTKAKSLITGVLKGAAGSPASRSDAAAKAAATRRRRAAERSTTAKKAARTRKQRDDRVEAMVEATRRD